MRDPKAGYVPSYRTEEAFIETGHLSTGTISVVAGVDPKPANADDFKQPIGFAAPKPRKRRRKTTP